MECSVSAWSKWDTQISHALRHKFLDFMANFCSYLLYLFCDNCAAVGFRNICEVEFDEENQSRGMVEFMSLLVLWSYSIFDLLLKSEAE